MSFRSHRKAFEEGHFIGAADVLGALGEINAVPADFWREISGACHSLTQYEDRGRYWKKFKAAKQQLDDATSSGLSSASQ